MAFRRNGADTGRAAAPTSGDADQGDLVHLIVDEITWHMRQHKVSRAELAQAMKVSPGRISQILSGDENLTLRTLSGVCTALGTHVEFTLRPVDEPVAMLDDDDPMRPVTAAASAA